MAKGKRSQQEITDMRLEHFENYKKLRRKMDKAYLKVRNLENTGRHIKLKVIPSPNVLLD